ncbi:MAG TPA: DUF1579 family protein [Kofleriaceae bacterium]|nr:DUF1579 family protein [Kofleriaceae bacterium]
MDHMPTVTDEHKKLHALAGTWIGEETMAPSPWGAGGAAVGHYTGRVECDGFFVSQDYRQETDGAVSFRGHGIFGYDAEKKQFAWYWVDSMGSVPREPSWGTWSENTLQLTSQSPHNLGRYTYEFKGPDAYEFRLENSFDGGATWQTFMTGVYRRA